MLINQTQTNGHSILPANNILVITKYARRLIDNLEYSILILSQLEIALEDNNQVAIDELIVTHRSCNHLVMEGFRWCSFLVKHLNCPTSEENNNMISEITLLKSRYSIATGRMIILFSNRSNYLNKLIMTQENIKITPGHSHSINEAKMVDMLR